MMFWTKKRLIIIVFLFFVMYYYAIKKILQFNFVKNGVKHRNRFMKSATKWIIMENETNSTTLKIDSKFETQLFNNLDNLEANTSDELPGVLNNSDFVLNWTKLHTNFEKAILENYFEPRNRSLHHYNPLPNCTYILNCSLFREIPENCENNIGLAPFCVYKHECKNKNGYDTKKNISIATMLSLSRFDTAHKLLESDWSGAVFIAIYVTAKRIAVNDIIQSICSFNCTSRVTLLFAISMREKYLYRDGLLPINAMRTIAALEARKTTEYIFHLDIDFKIPKNIYANLTKTINTIEKDVEGGMKRTALIVPSFECYDADLPVPKTKQEMLERRKDEKIFPFHYTFPPGQYNTNYNRWGRRNEPYKIRWMVGYEPWHVVHKSAPVPDVRFVGRGMNKKAFTFQMYRLNYSFYVVPNAFILHYPHDKSSDYWRSGDHSLCIQQLYHIFHGQSLSTFMGM